jgi:trigger factor
MSSSFVDASARDFRTDAERRDRGLLTIPLAAPQTDPSTPSQRTVTANPDVQVADSGPCRKTLSFKIPPDKIKSHIEEVYASAARQVDIKGFRRGKVPRKILEQKFGPAILVEAKESLINSTFEDACREHSIDVLGRPKVDGLDEKPLSSGASLEFQVHCDVRPSIELKEIKGIEVPRGNAAVTDADLDEALRQLADSKRTLKTVDDPVAEGDFVKCALVYRNEAGDVVHERPSAQLNTNIPIAGTAPEEFSTKLVGATVGNALEVPITFPANFEARDARGAKGTVTMTIAEVLRVTPPPIDDELAKGFDFESLDALRTDLQRRLAEEKEAGNRRRQEEDILAILVNENPFDLPQSLVEDQARHNLELFQQRLQQAGSAEDEIERKLEEARPHAREDAERRVRVFFLLEAVAKKAKIFVTEGDIDVELRNIAAQNNATADEVRAYYEEKRLLPDLRVAIMDRRTREYLREHARFTD